MSAARAARRDPEPVPDPDPDPELEAGAGAEPDPDPADAAATVSVALRSLLTASRRLRGRQTQDQQPLSYAQYGLLLSLATADELSSAELSRSADLTPATVAQMLDSLEGAGLVTRRRAEADRRVILTRLSDQGTAVVAAHKARVEPRWRAALADFDDDELQAAAAVMDRIASFLEELGEQP